MSAAKRKVNPLTIQEKKAVILEVENSNGRTKSQIAEQFRIPKSTLSTILKEKERILTLNDTDDLGPQRKRMRMRRGPYPQLEEALFAWLQEQTAANQVVSGPNMLARSQELAHQLGVNDFKTSAGWLEGFKKRHGLAPPAAASPLAGRQDAADGWRPEATPEGTVPLTQLPAMLDDYAATDVFVVAEMGLLFDLTPSDAGVGACGDGELASRRFSVLVAASADGSQKLPLLVVGDRSISGANQPGRIAYHADPSAWIQPQYFSSWLSRRDGELAAQGRQALFLCEHLPVHMVGGGGRDALQLACMPPSPLTYDQLTPEGVLHALKRQYRRRVAGFLKERGRPPTAGEAVQLLSRAWWHDVDSDDVRRYHASVSLLREEVNGQQPPPPAEDGPELAALAGTRYTPPDGLTLKVYAAADDALVWTAAAAGGGRPPAGRAARASQELGPSPPEAMASPAPVKRERGVVERVGEQPAARRRPSSQEALKAVLVLQQFFQLREADEELDEVLSFVAFAREKIVKLHMQETRHDNGLLKLKKEMKTEKPDALGNVKFESPILSIDPDVDPEESKESPDARPPPPYVKPASDLLAPRKGGIRVGPQFQADVPAAPVGEAPDTDTSHTQEARWTPEHKLSEQQINQFVLLTRAVGMFARACDAGSAATQQGIHVAAANASRDVTRAHALCVLHRHDYQLGEALTSLAPEGGPLLCRDELEDWSVHETALFEDAITRHGKMFDLVRREYLPWKTCAQITEYYYMWKTTDRYVRRRRAKHIARRQAALAAASSPPDTVSPPGGATGAPQGGASSAPPSGPASPPAPSPGTPAAPAATGSGRPGQANDALTLLSPMLNALGTSVSIEPVTGGSRRSPDQRGGKAGSVDKLCGGVRLSGECSITPVPVSR